MSMIEKLEKRKSELVAKSKDCNNVEELRSIQAQIETINEDLTELREEETAAKLKSEISDERTAALNEVETRDATPDFTPRKGFKSVEERKNQFDDIFEKREKAGKDLKDNRAVKSDYSLTGELRAVTVGNGTTISVPHFYSPTINPDFPVVSSLIDGVDTLTLNGGESFRQPYVARITAGNYTSETGNAATADTTFAYADINRAKVTAYSEITEELQRRAMRQLIII